MVIPLRLRLRLNVVGGVEEYCGMLQAASELDRASQGTGLKSFGQKQQEK